MNNKEQILNDINDFKEIISGAVHAINGQENIESVMTVVSDFVNSAMNFTNLMESYMKDDG